MDGPSSYRPSLLAGPKQFLRRIEVDRAVFYAILLRGWQLLAGTGTVVLMTLFFTKRVQGYYFTFASLMALQTFFELGFNIVVINLCSHEWARLRLDKRGQITGDETARSRLISLGRLLGKWYAVAAFLFVVLVGVGGAVFLAQKPEPVRWQEPWLAIVVLTGLLLWTLPFNALLEGCNQVGEVNKYRLIQAAVASVSVWTVMVLGGGLWAAVAATAARLLTDLYLLGIRYRRFFRPFWRPPSGATMSWRAEIWPWQWRLALQGIFAYFNLFLLTPVMFYYHGPVIAGQMGMTWTVVTALQAAALAWVQTRVPRFGMLVRNGEFKELDRVFFRVIAVASCALFVGGASFWCLLYGLHIVGHSAAGRLLSPLPTALCLVIMYSALVSGSQAFYVRAHKREPFVGVNVTEAVGGGLSVWWLGSVYGPTGAILGMLAIRLFFATPAYTYLWWRCRMDVR